MLLVALGPLSRVGDPAGGRAGVGDIALLAPDSIVYLDAARSWSGVGAAPWTRWGYLALLRIGHLLGDAATVAVLGQLIAVWAAGTLLLRLGRRLAGTTAGVAAAAVLLLNPMTAQWTRFVLTEPIFYALAITVVVLAVDAERGRDAAGPDGSSAQRWLITSAAAAVLLRPTGPLLAGSALALAAWRTAWARPRRRAAIAVIAAGTVAVLAVGAVVTGPPAEATFAEQLRAGVVVEGTPDVRTTIPMPSSPDATGVVPYVLAHPLASARLAVTRVVVEVAQVRRHYPPAVNPALGGAMLVMLTLATVGLRDPRGRPLRGPTAAVLLPLVGITAATFAVPEGRYGWAGLIALAPAVGVGAQAVIERTRRQPTDGMAR